MTTKKQKLSDVAKTLQMTPNDLIALFSELQDGTEKKSSSTLTEAEVNLVLEYVTQHQQVTDGFAAYFATKNSTREEVAQQSMKKGNEKKAAHQQQNQGKKQPQDRRRPQQQNAAGNNHANNNNGNGNGNPNNSNSAAKKPQQAASNQKNQPQAAAQPKKQPAAAKPASQPNNNNNNNHPEHHKKKQKQQPQAQKRGERLHVEVELSSDTATTTEKRRTVDTRGSYVDLDKYNQRYEQIAPAGKYSKDNYSTKKQKINQKSAQRNKQKYSNKRETEQDRLRRLELEKARKQQLKVRIPESIVVSELASRLKVTATEVIKKLMGLGVMATVNQEIDFDTAYLVAGEFHAKVEREVVVTIEERIIDDSEDNDENLQPRDPVVVVMGHVDHGKTSILDAIRKTSVTSGEAGGITQHIRAYRVNIDGQSITFLDTPGHAAFTSMRARGAQVTDIAILVVAADDGIMPQTIEAINHAKAAGVSIIVAINKMDKPTANPDKVMQQLTEHELVPEEWGGDVIVVPVSAHTGMGLDKLLETVLLVAEMKELKANPARAAKGTVVEARLDKGRGPIATVLVQNGTLHAGDVIVAGTAVGRVRAMTDEKGMKLQEAGPSVPVEIMGLDEVPTSGDIFNAVTDERLARELVEQRKTAAKEEQFSQYQKVTLDNLFDQMQQGDMKELDRKSVV